MNKVINIKNKDLWVFLSNLKGFLRTAKEYNIPLDNDKEPKVYKDFIRDLAA